MEINELISQISDNKQIELGDIPELDLYMDQVIQLFESKLGATKRNVDDKVLTKTMINNYSKAKLLMTINNKKYSKNHLILMSLIYNLKGALSINDIKLSINEIVEEFENGDNYDLKNLYNLFLDQCTSDSEEFKNSVDEKIKNIQLSTNDRDKSKRDYDERLLLLCSLINMSNMYRRLSEKIIDEFFKE